MPAELMPAEDENENAALNKELEEAGDTPFDMEAMKTTVNSVDEGEAEPEPAETEAKEEPEEPAPKEDAGEQEEIEADGDAGDSQKAINGLRNEMIKERNQRQEMERRVQMMTTEFQTQLAAAKAPPPKPIPDQFEDPEGFENYQRKDAEQKWQKMQDFKTAQESQQAHQKAVAEVQAHYKISSDKYSAEHEDYNDAVNFASERRMQELKLAHPGATDAQVFQAVQQEGLQVISNAIKAGKDPAETLHNMAKIYGYQKQEDTAVEDNKKAAIAKAKRLDNGQKSSRSMGKSAATKGGDLTSKDLSVMSGEDFDKNYAKIIAEGTGDDPGIYEHF